MSDTECVRTGGLEHLQSALDTLNDDFKRLDATIEGLASTLKIKLLFPEPLSETTERVGLSVGERSIIEQLTNTVCAAQRHSGNQRSMIEQIVEAIQ